MLKDKMREFVKVRYKQLLPVQYILLIAVAMISLALVYAVKAPVVPANVTYPASLHHSGVDMKEITKQAILEWMKENSRMPEHVLTKIYHIAMNSVNADLILAICLVESNFNPHVESEKGAIGLMGIMPSVWLDELRAQGIVKGKEDLYKISNNIESGVYVLDRYLEKTKNLRTALSRYAGGDSSYATRVLRMMNKISLTRSSEQQLALATAPVLND
jgi:soluble lytic murein transglycosylase-like protein